MTSVLDVTAAAGPEMYLRRGYINPGRAMPVLLAAPLLIALVLIATTASAQHALAGAADTREWTEHSLSIPVAGRATAYVPRRQPQAVVLFISGDGGWTLGVVDMARRLAPHAVVIGISFPALRRAVGHQSGCWYPAGDLETIARSAEKQLGLPEYRPPIVVGYSSGATLAYAAVAAAPAGTFAGALSLGFCPDLEIARRLCAIRDWKPSYDDRKHVSWLPPQPRLAAEWYVFHGVQDQVCDVRATRAFVKDMAGARFVEVEKTGHGFSRPAHWGQPFDAAIAALAAATPGARAQPAPDAQPTVSELQRLGLPLVISIPAAPRAFFIFVSGDGGWADLDRGVADALSRAGVGVVGWSSIRYFWRAKTPQQVAMDLRRIVTVLERAGKPVVAGGYSFGAEVVPVALARSPAAQRPRLAGIVSIAPARTASFEIDPLDWIRTPADTPDRVAPALAALGLPNLCVRPADERESGCPDVRAGACEVVTLPGSHHFNGRYTDIAAAVGRFIARIAANPSARPT